MALLNLPVDALWWKLHQKTTILVEESTNQADKYHWTIRKGKESLWQKTITKLSVSIATFSIVIGSLSAT